MLPTLHNKNNLLQLRKDRTVLKTPKNHLRVSGRKSLCWGWGYLKAL